MEQTLRSQMVSQVQLRWSKIRTVKTDMALGCNQTEHQANEYGGISIDGLNLDA